MSKQREEGFYRIKIENGWTCGYFYGDNAEPCWEVIGREYMLHSYSIQEIGEKINMPE